MKYRNQKEHAIGRTKGFASILGVAVLMVVLTACGGEATATPPPTQDTPLTTVIAMAMADDIREIQVDGQKLTVYPKTARGGADSFVSRIGDDTDIIRLLIDSGVDVGPTSGVEVTFKGISAKDVQAAIAAALATSIVHDVVVTPTPGPALTPTSTANPTTIQVPQRPLIRLSHNEQVYKGVAGNFCWPVETGVSLCGDEPFLLWEVLDTATAVPMAMVDSIIVEIDADDQPKSLQAAIFDNASKTASAVATQVIKLETGLTAPFAVDLPAGTYYIRISGQWDDGDIAYKFKMMVTS